MRQINAAMLQKLKSLQQTAAAGCEPRAVVKINLAPTMIDENSNQSLETLLETTLAAKSVSVAVRRQKANADPDRVYVAYVSPGKNIFDKTKIESGQIYSNGDMADNPDCTRSSEYIRVASDADYSWTISGNVRAHYYDANKTWLSSEATSSTVRKIHTPENCTYIKMAKSSPLSAVQEMNIQLEEGAEITEYAPFTDTVYAIWADISRSDQALTWSAPVVIGNGNRVAIAFDGKYTDDAGAEYITDGVPWIFYINPNTALCASPLGREFWNVLCFDCAEISAVFSPGYGLSIFHVSGGEVYAHRLSGDAWVDMGAVEGTGGTPADAEIDLISAKRFNDHILLQTKTAGGRISAMINYPAEAFPNKYVFAQFSDTPGPLGNPTLIFTDASVNALGGVMRKFDARAQMLYSLPSASAVVIKSRTADEVIAPWNYHNWGNEFAPFAVSGNVRAIDCDNPDGDISFITVAGEGGVILFRYRCAADISSLCSGSWQSKQDSSASQLTLEICNADYDFFDAETSLFAPGVKISLAFAVGNTEPLPMGSVYIDDIIYDAFSATASVSGRSSLCTLDEQLCDEAQVISAKRDDLIAYLLDYAGLTRHIVQTSDYMVSTSDFSPSGTVRSYIDAYCNVDEYISGALTPHWEVVQLADDTVIVGTPAFISQYQHNSVYAFNRDTEVLRRSTKKTIDAAYNAVHLFYTIYYYTGFVEHHDITPIPRLSNWVLPPHKNIYASLPSLYQGKKTEAEQQAIADETMRKLLAQNQYVGVTESFTGFLRPHLLCGDVASTYTGDDPATSTDIGVITALTHRWGKDGFWTDFSISSGGDYTEIGEVVTVETEKSSYNRRQNMADLISIISKKGQTNA